MDGKEGGGHRDPWREVARLNIGIAPYRGAILKSAEEEDKLHWIYRQFREFSMFLRAGLRSHQFFGKLGKLMEFPAMILLGDSCELWYCQTE